MVQALVSLAFGCEAFSCFISGHSLKNSFRFLIAFKATFEDSEIISRGSYNHCLSAATR